ncbi:MAG: N-acyl homoserine lactonase family protein [Alphaproteobacteria bacterium]
MTVKLYAMTCGWLTMKMKNFVPGEDGELRIPVPCYLIDHPKGRAVFDSGLHRSIQHDPAKRMGERLSKAFKVEYKAGEDIAARLATLDIDIADIKYLINSHLHFDHAGGNEHVPNAQMVIQRREWQAAQDPDLAHANGFHQQDIDHGHDVNQVDGEHDLFGDGSVVCLPTYGHTPGHQSLKVKLESGDVVLTGDACYLRRTMEELVLPAIFHDRDQMMQSLLSLRRLRDAGARIFYGLDPDFWATVPQAPAQVG